MIKPKRIYKYHIQKQADGLFSVIELSVMENGEGERKRTVHKNLYHSDAESMVYTLESLLKTDPKSRKFTMGVKRLKNPEMPVKTKRRRYK